MLFLDIFFHWNDLLILFLCASCFFSPIIREKRNNFQEIFLISLLVLYWIFKFLGKRQWYIFIPKVRLKFIFHLLTFIFYVMAAPLTAMLNGENLLAEVQYIFFSWFVWNLLLLIYHKLTVSILPLSLFHSFFLRISYFT